MPEDVSWSPFFRTRETWDHWPTTFSMSFCKSLSRITMCNLHWCYTFCTGVTLFALLLHLKCTALSQSESSNFFKRIISVVIVAFFSVATWNHLLLWPMFGITRSCSTRILKEVLWTGENTRTPRMRTGFDFGLEPVIGAKNVGSRIYSERIFPRFSPLTKNSLIYDLGWLLVSSSKRGNTLA